MEYILLTTLFHIFVFGLSLSILYIFIIEPMTFRNMSNITATLAENIISDQIRKYNDKEKYKLCNIIKDFRNSIKLIEGSSYKNSNNILLYIIVYIILISILLICIHYIYNYKLYNKNNFYYYILDLIMVALTLGGIELLFFVLISSRYNTFVNYLIK